MQKYTRLQVEELKERYYKETQDKWKQTAASMSARGLYNSGAHVHAFLGIGFDYINKLVEALFETEKTALSSEQSIQPESYFVELNEEAIKLISYEYGIIRSKALEIFKVLGDRVKDSIIIRIQDEESSKRESINRQVQILQEEIKMQRQLSATASYVVGKEENLTRYDVVLSFAGENREYAEKLANLLSSDGFSVFYDRYEEHILWGKNLYEHLSEIYSKRGKYCVMFLSKHYAAKQWPTLERRSAQERALKESKEYILPIRIDDTEIPGIHGTVGYLDLREKSIEDIYEILKKKLLSSRESIELTRIEPEINSIGRLGLSDDAISLVKLLSDRSEHGRADDPSLTAQEVLDALNLSEEAIAIAADELHERGFVKLVKAVSMGKIGFRYISTTEALFASTDSYLKEWDTEKDSVTLAQVLVAIEKDGYGVSIKEADDNLRWGPRRLNPALFLLIVMDMVDPSKSIHPDYISIYAILKPKIRRYIKSVKN